MQKIEIKCILSGEVKAVGDMRLEVLGVPYGGEVDGKDKVGEYFDPETDIALDVGDTVPVFEHHALGEKKPKKLGKARFIRKDSKGYWFEIALDKAVSRARELWKNAKDGLVKVSSGALSHLVRKMKDGKVTVWPVGEMSLISLADGQIPANDFAVAYPMKAYMAAIGETKTVDEMIMDHRVNRAVDKVLSKRRSVDEVIAESTETFEKHKHEARVRRQVSQNKWLKESPYPVPELVNFEPYRGLFVWMPPDDLLSGLLTKYTSEWRIKKFKEIRALHPKGDREKIAKIQKSMADWRLRLANAIVTKLPAVIAEFQAEIDYAQKLLDLMADDEKSKARPKDRHKAMGVKPVPGANRKLMEELGYEIPLKKKQPLIERGIGTITNLETKETRVLEDGEHPRPLLAGQGLGKRKVR